MDDTETEKARVHADNTGAEIRLDWGATHLRMSVTEAVDLLYDLVDVLGEIPRKPLAARRVQVPHRITRDEGRVRAAAEIREAL